MSEKKEQSKFTIQFNPADPAHQTVIDILNQQGRRKAQFIANAVQHYLHCRETPDIPQAALVDTHMIEEIVRRLLEKQDRLVPQQKRSPKQKNTPDSFVEDITIGEEAAGALGQEGLEAIRNTMQMFRNFDV